MTNGIDLGVNIDHVATLRQARGTTYPDTLQAALVAIAAGAAGITVHLREDRRHIQEHDVERLVKSVDRPVNLEMAVTEEMLRFAEMVRAPHCCLVPEKREELTTEGGLDVAGQLGRIRDAVARLLAADYRVSLFIDPSIEQVEAARDCGAPVVELHTGAYAEAEGRHAEAELQRLREAAAHAASLGLIVHAGHGLTAHNVKPVAAMREVSELNIGHWLVSRAVFVGLGDAVKEMIRAMNEARA